MNRQGLLGRPVSWLLATLLACSVPAFAQDSPPATPADPPATPAATPPANTGGTDDTSAPEDGPPPVDDLTTDQIDAARAALPEDLDETTRKSITDLYDKATAALKDAAAAAETASDRDRERLGGPALSATIKAELDEPAPESTALPPPVSSSPDDPSAELKAMQDRQKDLDQRRTQAAADLEAAQGRLADLETEQGRRTTREAAMPAEQAQLALDIEQVQTQLAEPAPEGELPALTQARQFSLGAEKKKLVAATNALEQERLLYRDTSDLVELRKDRWRRRISGFQADDKALQAEINRVATEANKLQQAVNEQMRDRLAEQLPDLTQVLDVVKQLNETQATLLPKLDKVAGEEETLGKQLDTVRERYTQAVARARNNTLVDTTDVRLRRHRGELPDIAAMKRAVSARRQSISSAQLAQDDLRIEKDKLPTIADARDRILAPLSAAERALLVDDVTQNLQLELDLYKSLGKNYASYVEELLDVQMVEQQLIVLTEAYLRFIDTRILWLRSAEVFSFSDFGEAFDELQQWVPIGTDEEQRADARAKWSLVFSDVGARFRDRPGRSILVIVIALGIIVLSPFCRRRIHLLAPRLDSVVADRMRYSWETLAMSVARAFAWASVPAAIAWYLSPHETVSEPTAMLQHGFGKLAYGIFTVMFLREVCLPRGLGEAHFGWGASTCEVLRRNATWLIIVDAPLLLIVATLESQIGVPGKTVLGRLAFMGSTMALAVFAARVLKPRGGVAEGWISAHKGGWTDRLRYGWYTCVVAIPAATVIMAAEGYYYTAIQINRSVGATYWLIIIVAITNGMTLRGLAESRRRLRRAELEEKAAKERQAEDDDEPATESDEGVGDVEIEKRRLDIEQIGAQTRKLVQTALVFAVIIGFWIIWTQTFPALTTLNRVHVWPKFAIALNTTEESVPSEILKGAIKLNTKSMRGATSEVVDGNSDGNGNNGSTGSTGTDAEADTGTSIIPIPGMSNATKPRETVSSPEDSVVTLSDVFRCIMIVVFTFMIGRNLPGVLEIVVLSRLPLEASARYAITTIVQYVVIILGIVSAFSAINIGWGKVQWLVAAVSVGLGFGLQEIVANFVSGIIILFEQPIRVGDTVTVGTVSGTVTRIRMRATTIMGWDRKELLVPNKEFVTGQIVNWTLTDQVLRVTVPVGFAYGTNTEKAKLLMRAVAESHTNVLDDPAPMAIIVGFGESAIEGELRFWLPNMDNFLSTRDALIEGMATRFRNAGIEIAFPQLDLHLRSRPGQDIIPRGQLVGEVASPGAPATD